MKLVLKLCKQPEWNIIRIYKNVTLTRNVGNPFIWMTTGCSSRPGYNVVSYWYGRAVAKHEKQKYALSSFTDSWFQTFAVFWMLYTFFRVTSRRVVTYPPMKMAQTECSETLAYKIQTPGNYPQESIQVFPIFIHADINV